MKVKLERSIYTCISKQENSFTTGCILDLGLCLQPHRSAAFVLPGNKERPELRSGEQRLEKARQSGCNPASIT